MKLTIAVIAVIAVLALRHPAARLSAARGGTLGCHGLERLWEQAGGPA